MSLSSLRQALVSPSPLLAAAATMLGSKDLDGCSDEPQLPVTAVAGGEATSRPAQKASMSSDAAAADSRRCCSDKIAFPANLAGPGDPSAVG